jgi:iron complex outermembrane receptor protein
MLKVLKFTLCKVSLVVTTILGLSWPALLAEEAAVIEGSVRYADGRPVHNAAVLLIQLKRETATDEEGRYRFAGVAPGTYDLVAHSTQFVSQARLVTVLEGSAAQVDFVLQFTPIRETVTVTATGRHETAFTAVQSVASLDAFDLAGRMATSVGEVLEGEPGIAKRSFGPGSSRPIIRGFDGDRVLVLQDGIPLGALGSQSGDHSEPIDPGSLERLEVVKGPATLLYGSSALGGVVNAISRHHEMHKHRHEGLRGQLSSALGSNNDHAGANIFAEYGTGNWMFWSGGGGQRTGDYESALGRVENSKTRLGNLLMGLGWFSDRAYLSFGYRLNDGRYGIPFAAQLHAHEEDSGHEEPGEEEGAELQDVDLTFRHHGFRLDAAVLDLGKFFDSFQLTLGLTDWHHEELEIFAGGTSAVGTQFDNRQFTWRGVFEQRRRGKLSGTVGFSGQLREYDARGEEALAPPVDQTAFAVFTVQEANLERVKLQFGGRLERTRYEPTAAVFRRHDGEAEETVLLPERTFTGFSLGAGMRVQLWPDGAFVANYTNGYRAPALEELYNFGPHLGNLAFEVGNPNLSGERTNGFDFSLRHSSEQARAELNVFYYSISDFIYLVPTGELEHGLFEAEFLQGDSRFLGTELQLDVGLNAWMWLTAGLDLVDAELSADGQPLPRIPPLRGRLGLDLRQGGFSVRPEVVLASRQREIYTTETPTAGYAVVNLKASYTIPRQHFAHHFTAEIFNVGDRVYRNHTSFIKDLAPEMGTGLRVGYVMTFF